MDPTSRARELEAAFASEACRALAEHARDIVVLMRSDGTLVLVNDAACAAYGYSRDELLGTSIRDLRAPDTRAQLESQMATANRSGVLFETMHVRRDGATFPVEVSSRGVDIAGEQYLLSVIRDISTRRARESERDSLMRDLEAANHQLEGLLAIVSSAVGKTELEDLLGQVVAALAAVMRADASFLFVCDGKTLRLRAVEGLDLGAGGFSMGVRDGFAGQVLAAGEALWVGDVQGIDAAMDVHSRHDLRAMYGVPLFLDGSLYGVLEVAWRSERLVSESERVMLQVAADRVMAAVAGAQRFEATRRAQVLDAALSDAVARLNASHDLDRSVTDALMIASVALDLDVAAFGAYTGEVWDIQYAVGLEPTSVRLPGHPRNTEEVGDVLPVVRVGPDTRPSEWLTGALDVAEAAIVPVQVRGEWYGAILLGRREPRGGFDDLTADFTRRFSSALSFACANASEYEAEHRIAETLQEALLTLDGRVDGVRFGHLYRSSTVSTRVGGDFYDVFHMGGDRIGMLLGDVSGKGLDAAVLTTLVKHTIRAFGHEERSPAEVVARTNRVLSAAAKLPDFASVILLSIDVPTGEVRYCCAGHPPAIVRRADGTLEQWSCGSPVIGAFPELEFTEDAVRIEPGDVVMLYTDGVTEARRPGGEFFGEARLLDFMHRTRELDVTALPDALYGEVMEFSGGRLADDVALLAFRLT